ncbi:MAG: O-antigen ligase family protein [Butyricicoccus sp.]|nr:O-antigen ligase family protein [Butyricicoccus sp.]
MKQTSKAAELLEKIFWIFLFVNPFLDIINGVYINLVMGVGVLDVKFTNTLGVTPSLVARMVMLVAFALYILIVRDRKSILTALPIGACWILSMVGERVCMGALVSPFADAQYAARFCYNIVILMVYTRVFAARWGVDGKALLRRLDGIIAFTLTVLSLSILISAIVGVGYSTYADRMGYRGSRGFFYAGNDITAVLALLLPLCTARFMEMDRKNAPRSRVVLYLIAGGLSANALMIIGSKTAFIAVGVNYGVMLAAALLTFAREKKTHTLLGFAGALGAALAVFAVIMLLSAAELWQSIADSFAVTGHVVELDGIERAMLSGRSVKLAEHFELFKNGGVPVWLFGMGRGSQQEVLEMDVFEVLFYYGIAGCLSFLWLYAKAAIGFFKGMVRRPDIITAALFTALGMCAGYLFIAGHVLFSVTSGFYFAFVIVYSRVFFAREAKEILLWKE